MIDAPIVRLDGSVAAENVALSRSVGWPDTDGDWSVLHDAAAVFGVRHGGILVAQGALGDYGDAGTIAKMVVAPDAQRRGLGARVLAALIAEAESRRIASLGLVATRFGRPLYARHGFREAGEVVVLVRAGGDDAEALTPEMDAPLTASLTDVPDALAQVVAYDARVTQCRRERMLRGRARIAGSAIVASRADGLSGFAFATPLATGTLIGPVLADDDTVARGLVRSLIARLPGVVGINVPGERTAFRTWLRAQGFEEKETRAEMAWNQTSLPWQAPERYALATQAWA
jgi:GNAT superfamily N-acetyltransferase